MRWVDIFKNAFRAWFRPSPAMARALLLIVASILVAMLATEMSEWLGTESGPESVGTHIARWTSTLLMLTAVAGFLVGILWLSLAYADRAGMLHTEDVKLYAGLVRDYLRGLVIRERR